ncbi:MAG: aspartate aminotransferase family protein [Planctomycetota bacterium]|nr:MAG: aspartate aminotransferase family protein [Planctomycetota bacterium]
MDGVAARTVGASAQSERHGGSPGRDARPRPGAGVATGNGPRQFGSGDGAGAGRAGPAPPRGEQTHGRLGIPERGMDPEELLQVLERYRERDADWRGGRTWSLVYDAGPEHHALLQRVQALFCAENGLNPMAFPSVRRMEAEVVAMTASLLHAPPQAVGTMTSGGTESILLAVKAYRDRARARWPWIRRPEIVAPATIHVAFAKAAHYFGVRLRTVPVGPDLRADVRAMRRAIGRNTIALAASAPQYAHGVVDPIAELGELAQRHDLPLHVDACFGGFLLPWLERLGRPVPPFDFRVPGVTSMSADLHKYGYAPKGASVVIYRDMGYLRHQFFIATDSPLGVYASPTIQGTRSGAAIAAAWASLCALGEEGMLRLAEEAVRTADRLRAGIAAIPELEVLGAPESTIVAYRSRVPEVDIYAVADRLAARGWCVDRQQAPPCIHCTVNASNARSVEAYLADLGAAVAEVRAQPSLRRQGEAAMYGMMARVPVRGLVRHAVRRFMERMYAPGAVLPELQALGEQEADGAWLGLARRYGERAIAVLDRLAALKRRWLG